MPACKVSRFVCDHANDFIGRFRLHDCACIYENTPSINEGVEALRIDQNNANAATTQTCSLEDRRSVIGNKCLDFRVPDDRHTTATRLRECREGTGNGYGHCGHYRDRTANQTMERKSPGWERCSHRPHRVVLPSSNRRESYNLCIQSSIGRRDIISISGFGRIFS